MIVGLVGVILVVGTKVWAQAASGLSMGAWVGYGLPFISTISLTLVTLYQRHLNRSQPGVTLPVTASLFVQAVTTAAVLYPLALFLENLEVRWTGQLIFAMFWLVVMLSIGAYGLMFKLLEYRTAARVSSLVYLTPPVTLVLSFWVFGDRLTWEDVVGLGVTAVGVWLVYRGDIAEQSAKRSGCTDSI